MLLKVGGSGKRYKGGDDHTGLSVKGEDPYKLSIERGLEAFCTLCLVLLFLKEFIKVI